MYWAFIVKGRMEPTGRLNCFIKAVKARPIGNPFNTSRLIILKPFKLHDQNKLHNDKQKCCLLQMS